MLSFGDVRLSDSHAQGVNADSVTRVRGSNHNDGGRGTSWGTVLAVPFS